MLSVMIDKAILDFDPTEVIDFNFHDDGFQTVPQPCDSQPRKTSRNLFNSESSNLDHLKAKPKGNIKTGGHDSVSSIFREEEKEKLRSSPVEQEDPLCARGQEAPLPTISKNVKNSSTSNMPISQDFSSSQICQPDSVTHPKTVAQLEAVSVSESTSRPPLGTDRQKDDRQKDILDGLVTPSSSPSTYSCRSSSCSDDFSSTSDFSEADLADLFRQTT